MTKLLESDIEQLLDVRAGEQNCWTKIPKT